MNTKCQFHSKEISKCFVINNMVNANCLLLKAPDAIEEGKGEHQVCPPIGEPKCTVDKYNSKMLE
ncbi:hypothetical protein J132_05840 [Termitomyces sp. J132]|nr:hypothetical protein J132_05840 [Termitomyces sp. J132]